MDPAMDAAPPPPAYCDGDRGVTRMRRWRERLADRLMNAAGPEAAFAAGRRLIRPGTSGGLRGGSCLPAGRAQGMFRHRRVVDGGLLCCDLPAASAGPAAGCALRRITPPPTAARIWRNLPGAYHRCC